MTYIYFTRDDLNRAITNHITTARNDKKSLTRIDKACTWLNMFEGSAWTLKTDVLTIKSRTSSAVYTVRLGEFCEHECKSTKPCWHETLASIIWEAHMIQQADALGPAVITNEGPVFA